MGIKKNTIELLSLGQLAAAGRDPLLQLFSKVWLSQG